MEMASIIISILALIGTVYTYFVHDRKIKRQESIINGLRAAKEISQSEDDIVLIHDGVRPIIDEELIINNLPYSKSQRHYSKWQDWWYKK